MHLAGISQSEGPESEASQHRNVQIDDSVDLSD